MRKPVIAAVRMMTLESGPRTSGDGGGDGPRRPLRVGFGSRITISSGISRITAPSSPRVKNWMSVLAPDFLAPGFSA
jgi:hypothetical protein